MSEIPTRMRSGAAEVAGLAPMFQKWAELCRRQVGSELSAALQWYLAGRADAHLMDAARIREATSPSVRMAPPSGGGQAHFVKAYEAFLGILASVSDSMPAEEPGDGRGVEEMATVMSQIEPKPAQTGGDDG